ncbi:MAG: VOC family protein [Actinobacteria bacterium]|nr:VOC family protein [Actinomycetota bacterium]
MSSPVVHFEIATADPVALGEFYSKLFGWNVQSIPEPAYTVVDTASGRGINGGFGKAEDEQSVKVYIEVADLDAALKKIESLGGKTQFPPTVLPMVTFAQFSDPDGNINGLVLAAQPGQEGPGVSAGSNPPLAWFEILGKDAAKLQKFYADAFGWNIKSTEVEGVNYGQVEVKDRGIPGGISAARDGKSVVTVYAEVDDLQKYLDAAAELGAKTTVEPMKVDEKTTIALFADPQGNAFGMYSGM